MFLLFAAALPLLLLFNAKAPSQNKDYVPTTTTTTTTTGDLSLGHHEKYKHKHDKCGGIMCGFTRTIFIAQKKKEEDRIPLLLFFVIIIIIRILMWSIRISVLVGSSSKTCDENIASPRNFET